MKLLNLNCLVFLVKFLPNVHSDDEDASNSSFCFHQFEHDDKDATWTYTEYSRSKKKHNNSLLNESNTSNATNDGKDVSLCLPEIYIPKCCFKGERIKREKNLGRYRSEMYQCVKEFSQKDGFDRLNVTFDEGLEGGIADSRVRYITYEPYCKSFGFIGIASDHYTRITFHKNETVVIRGMKGDENYTRILEQGSFCYENFASNETDVNLKADTVVVVTCRRNAHTPQELFIPTCCQLPGAYGEDGVCNYSKTQKLEGGIIFPSFLVVKEWTQTDFALIRTNYTTFTRFYGYKFKFDYTSFPTLRINKTLYPSYHGNVRRVVVHERNNMCSSGGYQFLELGISNIRYWEGNYFGFYNNSDTNSDFKYFGPKQYCLSSVTNETATFATCKPSCGGDSQCVRKCCPDDYYYDLVHSNTELKTVDLDPNKTFSGCLWSGGSDWNASHLFKEEGVLYNTFYSMPSCNYTSVFTTDSNNSRVFIKKDGSLSVVYPGDGAGVGEEEYFKFNQSQYCVDGGTGDHDRVRLCHEGITFFIISKSIERDVISEHNERWTFTTTFLLISTIFLLMVIIAYVGLREYTSLPGLIQLSYFIALLGEATTGLVGGLMDIVPMQKYRRTQCVILAVGNQLFAKAATTNLLFLTLHFLNTIRNSRVSSKHDSNKKRTFLLGFILAWGYALVEVSIALIISSRYEPQTYENINEEYINTDVISYMKSYLNYYPTYAYFVCSDNTWIPGMYSTLVFQLAIFLCFVAVIVILLRNALIKRRMEMAGESHITNRGGQRWIFLKLFLLFGIKCPSAVMEYLLHLSASYQQTLTPIGTVSLATISQIGTLQVSITGTVVSIVFVTSRKYTKMLQKRFIQFITTFKLTKTSP